MASSLISEKQSETFKKTQTEQFFSILTPPSDLLDNNPKFSQLLGSLRKSYLNYDGVSKNLHQELENTTTLLEKQKQDYLRRKMVLKEIKDMILDFEVESNLSKSTNQQTGFSQELLEVKAALVRSEARHQITSYSNIASQSQESGANSLLSLSLDSIPPSPIPISVKSVVKELAKRLASKLQSIRDFAELAVVEQSNGAPKTPSQFVSEIAKKKVEVESNKASTLALEAATDQLFLDYYTLLGKTLYCLVTLSSEIKLDKKAQNDQLNIKWLQSRAATMILKLSVLQHQVAVDTYNPETIAALNQIKSQIQAKVQETKGQLDKATKQLEQYESIGQGFAQLVHEYAKIMEAVKDKQWALEQLQGK